MTTRTTAESFELERIFVQLLRPDLDPEERVRLTRRHRSLTAPHRDTTASDVAHALAPKPDWKRN